MVRYTSYFFIVIRYVIREVFSIHKTVCMLTNFPHIVINYPFFLNIYICSVKKKFIHTIYSNHIILIIYLSRDNIYKKETVKTILCTYNILS